MGECANACNVRAEPMHTSSSANNDAMPKCGCTAAPVVSFVVAVVAVVDAQVSVVSLVKPAIGSAAGKT